MIFDQAIKAYLAKHNFSFFVPKAVLFDMDGVLFDTMPYHARAWQQAMAEYGIDFNERDAYLNEGKTGAATIDTEFQRTFGRSSTKEEQQEIYRLKSDYFQAFGKSEPMPCALSLVEKIRQQGLQRLIVTGSGERSVFERIEGSYPGALFSPELMVTAYDVQYGKPHPEPYLMGLQKASVQPYEAIVIENAPLGVQASVAANIFTIAVNTGILEDSVLRNAGADMVFSNMKELYQNWEKIEKWLN